MIRLLKQLLLGCVFFFALLAQAMADALSDAQRAFDAGDYAKAATLYLPLAKQGNAVAQFHLGLVYSQGLLILSDYPEATQWYLLAANQGYAPAQVKIGAMYAQGQWVPQDYKKAVQWFQYAADQNDASAQFNLGEMYTQGHGVLQDYYKAFQWYHLAANQNHALAQYKLGQAYANGRGVIQDNEAALIWFNLAAANAADAVTYDKYIGQRDLIAKQIAAEKIAKEKEVAAIKAKEEQVAQAEMGKEKVAQTSGAEAPQVAAEKEVQVDKETPDRLGQEMRVKAEPVVVKQAIPEPVVTPGKSGRAEAKLKGKSSRHKIKKKSSTKAQATVKAKEVGQNAQHPAKSAKVVVNKVSDSIPKTKNPQTVLPVVSIVPKIKANQVTSAPVATVPVVMGSPAASATAETSSADQLILSPDEAAHTKIQPVAP